MGETVCFLGDVFVKRVSKLSSLKFIKSNNKGMSLVEVLVAAGLMALVAAGLVGTITAMNREQNNQVRLATFRELKSRIQFLITDQNSWNMTLKNNSSMDCLVQHTGSAPCTSGSATDLVLYDSSGAAFFTPPTHSTIPGAGSNGFTDKGVPCTGFNGNAGAGLDSCPISYKMIWEPICNSTSSCKNPLVRVTARMLYNPSSSAVVTSFSLGTGPVANNEGGAGKYDVVIKRSATTINKSFSLAMREKDNVSAAPPGSNAGFKGGGTCVGLSVRGTATNGKEWEIISDDFNLITSLDTATGKIKLSPGTYSCKITASGWAVDSFQIKLYNATTGVDVAGSYGASNAAAAPNYNQAVATSTPVISISTESDFQLLQSCQNMSTTPTQFQMGLPAQPYTGYSVYGTMTCSQTN